MDLFIRHKGSAGAHESIQDAKMETLGKSSLLWKITVNSCTEHDDSDFPLGEQDPNSLSRACFQTALLVLGTGLVPDHRVSPEPRLLQSWAGKIVGKGARTDHKTHLDDTEALMFIPSLALVPLTDAQLRGMAFPSLHYSGRKHFTFSPNLSVQELIGHCSGDSLKQ